MLCIRKVGILPASGTVSYERNLRVLDYTKLPSNVVVHLVNKATKQYDVWHSRDYNDFWPILKDMNPYGFVDCSKEWENCVLCIAISEYAEQFLGYVASVDLLVMSRYELPVRSFNWEFTALDKWNSLFQCTDERGTLIYRHLLEIVCRSMGFWIDDAYYLPLHVYGQCESVNLYRVRFENIVKTRAFLGKLAFMQVAI